ncbi:hypothetical protein HDV06_003134 [Boothiomyces sp. JEL0866]|nr:hypothetical protein HDV06_003117 [Boothiomyces sp. JEL0866]KAJ3322414.1 hypothetical protein HDV06_003134 [Boothiomyces sp. JEL0866]
MASGTAGKFNVNVLKASALMNFGILTALILSACKWIPIYAVDSEATFLVLYNTIWSALYSISLFLLSKAWTLYCISNGTTFDSMLVFISRFPTPSSFKGQLTSVVIILIPMFGMIPSLIFKSCLQTTLKTVNSNAKIDIVNYVGEVINADNNTDPYTAGALIQGQLMKSSVQLSSVMQVPYSIDFTPTYDTNYNWSTNSRPDGVPNSASEVFAAVYQPSTFAVDISSTNKTFNLKVPASFIAVKCELVDEQFQTNRAQSVSVPSNCDTSQYWQTFGNTVGVGACGSDSLYDLVVMQASANQYMHCSGEAYNGTVLATFQTANGMKNVSVTNMHMESPTKNFLSLYSVASQGVVAATAPVRRMNSFPNFLRNSTSYQSIKKALVSTILATDLGHGYIPDPSITSQIPVSIVESQKIITLNLVGGVVLLGINVCTLLVTFTLLFQSAKFTEVNAKNFIEWIRNSEHIKHNDMNMTQLVESETVYVVSNEEGEYILKPKQ